MKKKSLIMKAVCIVAMFCWTSSKCICQITQSLIMRGYASITATYQNDTSNFGLGEQVLFFTSQISDRTTILAESVFKFSPGSPTSYNVSIERIILKSNIFGNHNLLIGKQHTPVSYWNYTYHHGVVFSPTIDRPLFFAAEIIPLHTTGIGLQAANLTQYKIGYDFLVGNGIGASEVKDNDKRKSITAAFRLHPIPTGIGKELTLGMCYYNDVIARGAKMHDGSINHYKTNQQIGTASFSYFGSHFEGIAEGIAEYNHTDTMGTQKTTAGYLYAGIRFSDTSKLVPYLKADYIHYEKGEIFHMDGSNVFSLIAGIRYEINYLSVLKLEFQHSNNDLTGAANKVALQWSVGF